MLNPNITIIDYDCGNMHSVLRASEYVGMNVKISNKKEDIINSDAIILPGVGAFEDAMLKLEKYNLIEPILNFNKTGKFIMGICLGMQLLLSSSSESLENNKSIKGLSLIKGRCKKFSKSRRNKVPQIQWNTIYNLDKSTFNKSPLEGFQNNSFMYFIHSYYAYDIKDSNILTKSTYSDIEYCSAIKNENIFGFQFHPEKSGLKGLKIYENFKKLIIERK